MSRMIKLFFLALMLVGIFISAFVIVTALQAAAVPTNAPAISETTSGTRPGDLVAQGRTLFVAKGCIVCHRNDDFSRERAGMSEFNFDDVPNLTSVNLEPAYLRTWLRDPQAVKPARWMPNLHLAETEIDALAAYLTRAP